MKNVKFPVTLHRVIRSSASSLIILFLAVPAESFKVKTNDEEIKKTASESTLKDSCTVQVPCKLSSCEPSKSYVIQLNKRVIPFVKKYISSEGSRLEKMKTWGKRYFDLYDRILSYYGLPKELKYLSVIESDLTSKAVSAAGAVGPWQIMAEEATRMGLKINSRVDERTNFRKSTNAAAKILRELYCEFNDWPLVIAAYNCGAGRVRQAMRKSGSKNFWNLQSYLPLETRFHVKRFIGTHFIFEGCGGLTTMTAAEVKDYNLKVASM
jgi:membrane-bound lytic murein transglycosylase D